jgi:hypothetical protein
MAFWIFDQAEIPLLRRFYGVFWALAAHFSRSFLHFFAICFLFPVCTLVVATSLFTLHSSVQELLLFPSLCFVIDSQCCACLITMWVQGWVESESRVSANLTESEVELEKKWLASTQLLDVLHTKSGAFFGWHHFLNGTLPFYNLVSFYTAPLRGRTLHINQPYRKQIRALIEQAYLPYHLLQLDVPVPPITSMWRWRASYIRYT